MHDAAYQKTFNRPQQEKIEKYIELAIEFNKTHNIFMLKMIKPPAVPPRYSKKTVF